MRPAAVVFDNDGLTLDTEQAWTRAEVALFARHGRVFDDDHKRDLLGSARDVAATKLERHLALPGRGLELMDELHALVMDELDRGVPAMPGAVALIDALRRAGTPVGLASNSSREFLDKALRVAGLERHFGATVAGDEVARPKPAPDGYLAVAAALGVVAADCVALEDSPPGVAAAKAAGMTVVGVPSFPGIALPEADLVVASLRDPAVAALLGLSAAA
jgi:HAD superfamily hydrolase (TIGR01509 family)